MLFLQNQIRTKYVQGGETREAPIDLVKDIISLLLHKLFLQILGSHFPSIFGH